MWVAIGSNSTESFTLCQSLYISARHESKQAGGVDNETKGDDNDDDDDDGCGGGNYNAFSSYY